MSSFSSRPDAHQSPSGKHSVWYDRNGNPITTQDDASSLPSSPGRYRGRRFGLSGQKEINAIPGRMEPASEAPKKSVPSATEPEQTRSEAVEELIRITPETQAEAKAIPEATPVTAAPITTTPVTTESETTESADVFTEEYDTGDDTGSKKEANSDLRTAPRPASVPPLGGVGGSSLKGIRALSLLYLVPLLILFVVGYILYHGPKVPELPVYDMAAFEAHSPYRYIGSFNRDFNDLNDLQLSAAKKIGVKPASTRSELRNRDNLISVQESSTLSIDPLTHSQALLVPEAAVLLNEIGAKFTKTLADDRLPLYSIIVTSVTRTDEDVTDLRKGNGNASDNSTHVYGTTFDISWRRFHKVDPFDPRDLSPDELKHLLAIVLDSFHEAGRCYIKHERYQACFHITTRK